jgi:RHS repeat-associated protein
MVEQARYGEYGVPYGVPLGDVNGDGKCNGTDVTQVNTWNALGAYDVRGDFDLDGDIDSGDYTTVSGQSGTTSGWGKLSTGGAAGGNRKGYAVYEFNPGLSYSLWHVRHRLLNSDLGRWARREPFGYVDGVNLYSYGVANPAVMLDPSGLVKWHGPNALVVRNRAFEAQLCY